MSSMRSRGRARLSTDSVAAKCKTSWQSFSRTLLTFCELQRTAFRIMRAMWVCGFCFVVLSQLCALHPSRSQRLWLRGGWRARCLCSVVLLPRSQQCWLRGGRRCRHSWVGGSCVTADFQTGELLWAAFSTILERTSAQRLFRGDLAVRLHLCSACFGTSSILLRKNSFCPVFGA